MNILLTSVGRRSYIVEYFRQALAGAGVVFAANSELTYAVSQADNHIITPLIYDPDYIPFLLQYCQDKKITALLSLFDVDLAVLAKSRFAFQKIGTRVILAEDKMIEMCNDKWKTHQLAKRLGLMSPATYKSLGGAQRALECGDLRFPVILKPRWGMASIGIYIANNHDELRVLYAKSNDDAMSGHLKYESSATSSEAILIQELLFGKEYGLDIVNDLEGNFVAVFAKHKAVMRAGETDIGVTVDPAPFKAMALSISQEIRHESVLSLDCFRNNAGIFLTELNCRISGHYPISHLAGVNVPMQIIRWLNGKGTDADLLKCEVGVTVIKDLEPRVFKFH